MKTFFKCMFSITVILMLLLVNVSGNPFGEKTKDDSEEILFSDDFNDNSKDYSKWSEIFTYGSWDETNSRTEFLINEPGNTREGEGIQSISIPVSLTTKNSVVISCDMISDIGSTGWVGFLFLKVTDGTNWVTAEYTRYRDELRIRDSNDASQTLIGSRGDGMWFNEIEIFSDGYEVTMDSRSSGWIADPLFSSTSEISVQLYIENGGEVPECYQKSGFDNVVVTAITRNNPPSPPLISGPSSGKDNTLYDFTFVLLDPDEDDMELLIDWDDDTTSEWLGPYENFENVIQSHSWASRENFTIRAKTMDSSGVESDWGSLEIAIPRNSEYAPAEPVDLEDGLVAYLSFDELDEGLVPDESMYGNYGDIDCNGQCESPAGFGMHFDGDDDSIVIDDDESINFEDTNAMSISLWIKRDRISSGHSEKLVSKSFTSTGRGYGLNIYEDNCIRFTVRTGSERLDIDSLEKIEDTEWHHIVATWDNGVETLYIDGELDSSVDHGSHTIANEYKNLELGLHYGWNSPFGGSMDEFRLYEKALSADEAEELYENPSDFEQMILIGKISGYDDNIGNLRIFHAEKLRVIQFGPFGYNVKTGQEKIKLSDSFIGYAGASFIFGIGSGRIYS